MIIRKIIRNGQSVKHIMRGGTIIWASEAGASLPKLATPVIYLSTESGGGEEIQGLTPAILGKAILGRAILGRTTASSLPKLSTPVIRIESVSDSEEPVVVKLSTPTIRLEVIDDEEPDVPVVTKLSTPEIYLYMEAVEPDEPEPPVVVKLATPEIWLFTETEEPDAPVVEKLSTPAIYLEVIEDEEPDEPDEPLEPDIPVLPKLDAPTIRIEAIEDEPDVPTPTKLAAPVIELVTETEVLPEKPQLLGMTGTYDATTGYWDANLQVAYAAGVRSVRMTFLSTDGEVLKQPHLNKNVTSDYTLPLGSYAILTGLATGVYYVYIQHHAETWTEDTDAYKAKYSEPSDRVVLNLLESAYEGVIPALELYPAATILTEKMTIDGEDSYGVVLAEHQMLDVTKTYSLYNGVDSCGGNFTEISGSGGSRVVKWTTQGLADIVGYEVTVADIGGRCIVYGYPDHTYRRFGFSCTGWIETVT